MTTLKSKEYGGLDIFRIIAALLIVGVHTSPLMSFGENIHIMVFRVFARICVPFFLMITGYFTVPVFFAKDNGSAGFPVKFTKKSVLLYAAATLIYLPISIYAGYYSEGNITVTALRNIFFDGTFYHLWYMPAVIIGVLLLYAMSRKLSLKTAFGAAILLYIIGLMGDSYYGITEQVPLLKSVYGALFQVFSYTRNGLFYAPVFLAMGASIAAETHAVKREARQRVFEPVSTIGFIVSVALMLCEGYTLREYSSPLHDSMYIMLLPGMYFLFRLLLSAGGKPRPGLRDISMWIYILHPLCIIGIRGAAGLTGLSDLLVENSEINYVAVCLASLLGAALITAAQKKIASRKQRTRSAG